MVQKSCSLVPRQGRIRKMLTFGPCVAEFGYNLNLKKRTITVPCYHPLTGYRSREINPSTGKRSIVFSTDQAFRDLPVEVPCGQCIGCRLERSRQWAIRCVHEASLYENNCFLTLTYSPENLPSGGTLVKADFQKFMKRLRKAYGDGIRYFQCGEYGDELGRPHYHACIFNHDFKDKVLLKTVNGNKCYVSETLEKLWGFGHCMIGDVTFESAAYVARYVTKKVTGKKALEHYTEIDYSSGEVLRERIPEYVTMSRRPGVGKPWLEKYLTDVFPHDSVVIRGRELSPPKYYLTQYEIENPEGFAALKEERKTSAFKNKANNTRDRLDVREFIQKYKCTLLKRDFENEK